MPADTHLTESYDLTQIRVYVDSMEITHLAGDEWGEGLNVIVPSPDVPAYAISSSQGVCGFSKAPDISTQRAFGMISVLRMSPSVETLTGYVRSGKTVTVAFIATSAGVGWNEVSLTHAIFINSPAYGTGRSDVYTFAFTGTGFSQE